MERIETLIELRTIIYFGFDCVLYCTFDWSGWEKGCPSDVICWGEYIHIYIHTYGAFFSSLGHFVDRSTRGGIV